MPAPFKVIKTLVLIKRHEKFYDNYFFSFMAILFCSWSGLPIDGSHFSLGFLSCIINRFSVLIRSVGRTVNGLICRIVDRRFTIVDLLVDVSLGILVDRLLIVGVLVEMCRSCRRRRFIVEFAFGVDGVLPRRLVTHSALPSCGLVAGSVDTVVIGVVVLLAVSGKLFLTFVTYCK